MGAKMTEYIRKADAIDAATQDSTENRTHSFRAGQARSASRIKALEPADVIPVVHSRWIKTTDGAECEKCGREAVYQIVDNHWEYEPWCPHCGSKMDKAEEET